MRFRYIIGLRALITENCTRPAHFAQIFALIIGGWQLSLRGDIDLCASSHLRGDAATVTLGAASGSLPRFNTTSPIISITSPTALLTHCKMMARMHFKMPAAILLLAVFAIMLKTLMSSFKTVICRFRRRRFIKGDYEICRR